MQRTIQNVRLSSNKSMGSVRQAATQEFKELVLADVLHALADPTRLRIVQELASCGQKACGSFAVDMAKSSLSHHFSILRKSGIIASVSEGTRLMNTLERTKLDSTFPGLLDSVLAAARRTDPDKSR